MMCDNQYNFAQPWSNNFYYHYLQQHAAMSYHFQKLHSNIHHYGNQYADMYSPAVVCNHADYDSSCSSSSSCCSSESCSKSTSSEYEEQEDMDNEEEYDENQYEDENNDEDESDCEYEFNVDAILAMRAAKEELKKQEQAEAKQDESSESKDGDSSKDEKESKSDSIVLLDSDNEDFEFIDLSGTRIFDCNLYKSIGGFNKTEEEENKKLMMEYLYGSGSHMIVGLETNMGLKYEQFYDHYQPSLWPVLPLRL